MERLIDEVEAVEMESRIAGNKLIHGADLILEELGELLGDGHCCTCRSFEFKGERLRWTCRSGVSPVWSSMKCTAKPPKWSPK